ncbi:MAG: RpiB/LacA/LacB family sugar-phosphate isomerase [Candidatus Pacebacteria bacterium]|nr:RpiB/LacA/LacB family sugar-phosphate isomerase [Candidatus Paceibacterota bacterium]
MKIYVGSDHAGFSLKKEIVEYLINEDFDVSDEGAFEFDAQDDYPDFISKVAEKVSKDPKNSKGIILGGSGQGEAIVANRFKNVRAVVYYGGDMDIVKLSREHNDANVLSLGARFISFDTAKNAVNLWLNTAFSEDERHLRRIKKVDSL